MLVLISNSERYAGKSGRRKELILVINDFPSSRLPGSKKIPAMLIPLNYLKVSGCKVGLIANFGGKSLE